MGIHFLSIRYIPTFLYRKSALISVNCKHLYDLRKKHIDDAKIMRRLDVVYKLLLMGKTAEAEKMLNEF